MHMFEGCTLLAGPVVMLAAVEKAGSIVEGAASGSRTNVSPIARREDERSGHLVSLRRIEKEMSRMEVEDRIEG